MVNLLSDKLAYELLFVFKKLNFNFIFMDWDECLHVRRCIVNSSLA